MLDSPTSTTHKTTHFHLGPSHRVIGSLRAQPALAKPVQFRLAKYSAPGAALSRAGRDVELELRGVLQSHGNLTVLLPDGQPGDPIHSTHSRHATEAASWPTFHPHSPTSTIVNIHTAGSERVASTLAYSHPPSRVPPPGSVPPSLFLSFSSSLSLSPSRSIDTLYFVASTPPHPPILGSRPLRGCGYKFGVI